MHILWITPLSSVDKHVDNLIFVEHLARTTLAFVKQNKIFLYTASGQLSHLIISRG